MSHDTERDIVVAESAVFCRRILPLSISDKFVADSSSFGFDCPRDQEYLATGRATVPTILVNKSAFESPQSLSEAR
jgi:hypothetical protein